MSVGISLREALAIYSSLTPTEAALYAVKYTEVLPKAGYKEAVKTAAAHVYDHREEIDALKNDLAERKDRRR